MHKIKLKVLRSTKDWDERRERRADAIAKFKLDAQEELEKRSKEYCDQDIKSTMEFYEKEIIKNEKK